MHGRSAFQSDGRSHVQHDDAIGGREHGRAEVGSLLLGVILGTLVCGDGQSNWYKGVQLVTVYSIIALMFFLIPAL